MYSDDLFIDSMPNQLIKISGVVTMSPRNADGKDTQGTGSGSTSNKTGGKLEFSSATNIEPDKFDSNIISATTGSLRVALNNI